MTQGAGVLGVVPTLGRHDHSCWRYDGVADVLTQAGAFARDCLEQGLHVLYVATGDPRVLARDQHGIDGLDEASTSRATQIASVDNTYWDRSVIDPGAPVAAYAGASEEALAAGYTGVRVVAEATSLVRTAEQPATFARYAHRVDPHASRPFSAMCGYHIGQAGEGAVAQLARMHPSSNCDASGFRLHTATRPGHATAPGGELARATVELLQPALQRADPSPRDGRVVVDPTGLGFRTHRSMLQLVGYARARDRTAVLRATEPGPRRVGDVLRLQDARVELVA